MIGSLRFSPSRLAIGYVALSVLALTLFAVPLWYAWRTNLATFKAYVQGDELQALVEVFDREGANGLTEAMASRAASAPRDQVMVFADPSKRRLAGNLPTWPAQVPDAPGTYGLVIDVGSGATMRVVGSHVVLPGGYRLLLARESVLFHAFIERFWFGIAGAVAIVLVLSAAVGWVIRRGLLSEVREISRTASAIVEGDLSRRLATRGGSPELDTLARSVNGMLAQLASQNVQLEGEVAVRRQAEQALHKAHDELEGVVAQRTAQLARANESLQLSEERYARAMEASDAGYWDWNVLTGEMFQSLRMKQMLGFPPESRFADRDDFVARIPFHRDDRKRVEDVIAATLEGQADRYEVDYRVVLPTGETRWARARGKVYRNEAGRAIRVAGSLSDNTDRKLAEEALRLSEERYARAMEASDEGHWEVNIASGEIFVSVRMNQIFGWAADTRFADHAEFVARAPFHPDDRQRVLDTVRGLVAGESDRYELEYRIVPRPGEIRWVRSRAKAFRDERGVGSRISGSLNDVTDRRRGEEALAESEARFRSLTKLSTDFFWETDVADRFTSVETGKAYRGVRNVAWSKLGKTRWEIPHVSPDEAAWTAHRAVIAARQRFVDFGFSRIENGAERFYEHSGEPRFDAQGRFLGYRGVGRDVTDRKLAEEALRESEDRFVLAVAGSNDGIWDWDVLTGEMFLSERAQRLYGLEPGRTIRPRTEWREMVKLHPQDAEAQRIAVEDYLAGREPRYEGEWRVRHPDGTYCWVRIRGLCVRDESGRATRMAGSVSDVDQQKRAEEALRLSEARYARAMEATVEGHWEWDVVTDDIFVSGTVNRLFGLPEDAHFKKRAELIANAPYHPDDREHIASAVHAGLTGASDRADFEYRIVLPPGQVGWLRARWKILRDPHGAPLRVTGVLTDITERKRAEEELRSRQEMLDLAQKAARAVAFEWRIGSGEGQNRWSPDLEAMYGLAPGTYDGTYETWKKLVFPEDWPAAKAAIRRANETGDVAAEYRVIHSDGTVHWLQAKGRMFFDAERKPTRLVGFMLDVTERHQAEEELRRLERQLRQAQRLEAMGTLAGGIAHDFNNILGAILGYGEMALRDAAKGSRLRRDLDSIMTAGERGRALVERILAFSRSSVNERVAVHVERVAREALDQLAAKLPANVTIAPRLRAGRAAVLGDPTQVHQVLMNLAMNAVQAMPSGGTVRVLLEPVRVDMRRVAATGTLEAGDYVVLEVADSGIGISPDVLERIFDPFFTTKEVGVGTGLGLSLVHGIVMELEGAIDVSSKPGAGSVFTVYLPRAGDATEATESETPDVPRGNHERVLVVDDEEPLVRIATETLEELGYRPVGFTSSTDALEAFRADPLGFDAVITDERMPGMAGSALIRAVRGIRVGIPIILMSGFIGGVVSSRAREAGADEVLKKPVSGRELATSLTRALHRAQAGVH